MYKHFFKPLFDFLLSLLAIIILSPFFLLFTLIVAIAMKGNPFFVQPRPGKNGKIFKMIKYRTMTNAKDENGELLPDEKRLTKFGKLMRKLSLDELPEIFNIFAGQMSIVGPRPLLVQYLPLYSKFQARRHEVRPGLTGLAQVSGRNAITWSQKFEKDVYYVDHISFWLDIKIFFMTIGKVLRREGISQEGQATMEFFMGNTEYNDEEGDDTMSTQKYKTKNENKINILVLSAGRRVELIKLLKEARDKLNIEGNVVAADMSETAPALYFADNRYILPRIGSEDYVSKLIQICKNEEISLVVPTIDTELDILSEKREYLQEQTGARILVSSHDCIDICNDKIKTAKFFKENGFDYPYTYSSEELNLKQYKLPLFIKPKDGSSSVNAFKIVSDKELDFFREYIQNPIVQECVCGQEYTFDIFVDFDGNTISIVPRKRLAVRSGEILKGQIDMDPLLIKQVRPIVEKLKPIGHITIQGICDEKKKIKFIEINPRFGGGAPMSIMAGADSCAWLYRLLSGDRVDPNEVKVSNGATYVRFDESIQIKEFEH